MKPSRYWLSFDLGVRGDYEALYEWLDALDAKECGDSVATFLSEKTREEIAEEISQLLGSDKKVRVYIIELKRGGRFILGKRKHTPWAGYAQLATEEVDEEK